MTKDSADARIVAHLDDEERAILRRACAATGKNPSAVIKAALRLYEKSLPGQSPMAIFERHGVIGAITRPRDLSGTCKEHIDFSQKHCGKK